MTFYSSTKPRKKSSHVCQANHQGQYDITGYRYRALLRAGVKGDTEARVTAQMRHNFRPEFSRTKRRARDQGARILMATGVGPQTSKPI
jgi:hypothetical protein